MGFQGFCKGQNKKRATKQMVTLLYLFGITCFLPFAGQKIDLAMMLGIIELHNELVVVRDGIEPPTHGFSVHCSTN